MNKEFIDKLKECVDHGIEISKDAMGKVCSTVEDLGEQGTTRLEISALYNKKKKLIVALGELVYTKFTVDQVDQVSVSDPQVEEQLRAINAVAIDIAAKEEQLAAMTKKD